MSFKGLDKLVESVVRNDNIPTNMDLLLRIWEVQGLDLTPDQKMTFKSKCSPPESITRVLRKIRRNVQKAT